MSNMAIWEALRTPPQTALKKIEAGRLKGKSDINPQWRYEAMTQQFGPCGIGWRYTIDRCWLEPTADGQVVAFAEVSLYVKAADRWSEAIPAIGGNMLVEKESKGLHVSDEAYKMAVTDALSVALKMIGVAADVYAGNMDGFKYSQPARAAEAKSAEAKPAADIDKLRRRFFAVANIYAPATNQTPEDVKEHFKDRLKLTSFTDADARQIEAGIAVMEEYLAQKEAANV